jgi:hypothetical protein
MRPADSKITIAPDTQAQRSNEDCTRRTHQHANTLLESYKHQVGHVPLDFTSCPEVDKTKGDTLFILIPIHSTKRKRLAIPTGGSTIKQLAG